MHLVTTPRIDYLRALAAEITSVYRAGRVIIAIDGPLQSGKTAFGDDLAAVFAERGSAVFRASLENFHRSRDAQVVFGDDTPERYYRFGFDYSLLRRVLLEPFRMAGSTGFVLSAFDPDRDAKVEPRWVTGPADAVLVVDGRFALRDELRDAWDYRILLAGDADDAADALYYKAERPADAASAVIDNSTPELPQRRFFDSC